MAKILGQGGKGKKTTLKLATQWLAKHGSEKQIANLHRYGITATKPYGIGVGDLKKYAKGIGRDQALAEALWGTARYEARMLALFVAEPEALTVGIMNAWAKDFDNWALVDTAAFHLFDRSPLAWKRIPQWAKSKREFVKRSAFALLWSLSVHDKEAKDSAFVEGLKLIEAASTDERNFVKKGVNMALRAIGKRNQRLNAAAIKVAKRLGGSDDSSARWIGTHALRELQSPAIQKRL